MNPLELRIKNLEDRLNHLEKSDRLTIQKTIQVFDGRNIQLGTGTGTQIGTAAGQKVGFHGATPVAQATAISAPSGGTTVDSQSRTAITALITAIKNFGITA